MAAPILIVEDGTGLVDANSYITVEFADTYLGNTGRDTDWNNLTDDQKTIFVYCAASWLDEQYRGQWRGRLVKTYPPVQALSFPRLYLYDIEDRYYASNVIPENIKKAQAEVAYLCLSVGLDALYPQLDPEGQLRRVNLADESIEQEFFKSNSLQDEPRYFTVEKKVRPFLLADVGSSWGFVQKIR